jgi:hypothetical protein
MPRALATTKHTCVSVHQGGGVQQGNILDLHRWQSLVVLLCKLCDDSMLILVEISTLSGSTCIQGMLEQVP